MNEKKEVLKKRRVTRAASATKSEAASLMRPVFSDANLRTPDDELCKATDDGQCLAVALSLWLPVH